MKLIVGLGNPGRLYLNTRHNIGASVVRALAKETGLILKKEQATFSQLAKGCISGQEVILALPFTFMNLSGKAVSSLLRKYEIKTEDLLVVCDDLDLEFGRMKIRTSGSSAGHKGMASIIEELGTQNFSRLRLGIGRPRERGREADFVLARFNKAEVRELDIFFLRAVICCNLWISSGIASCMNLFNKRRKETDEKI